MMLEELLELRSLKSTVICGVVIRMVAKTKKPINAVVIVTIVINREGPKIF